jgi:hypothetical protein
VASLAAAGADFVPLDEPVLTELAFSPGNTRTFMCAALAARRDPAEELALAVSLINRVVENMPVRIGVQRLRRRSPPARIRARSRPRLRSRTPPAGRSKAGPACRHAHAMTARGNNAQRQVKEVHMARPKNDGGTRGNPRRKATDQRNALKRRADQVKPLKRESSAAGIWKGGDPTALGGVKTRRRIPP